MPESPKSALPAGGLRVAITDYTFDSLETEREILQQAGASVEGRQCKTAAELIELTKNADAVITQFAAVTAPVIEAMKRARVIVRYGIGVDNVDLQAARKAGIPVCNVPDYCINEVADHTLALMLGATRAIVPNWDTIRAGKWGLSPAINLTAMKTLADLTVGVVGFGRIGRQVLQRLKAFNARVVVSDPVVEAGQVQAAGAALVSLDELWAQADVITLHCPSTPDTRRMINADTIRKMKPGVILINVGRGDLADPAALLEALQSGQISFAGLDVWDPEPVPADTPLRKAHNAIVTAHIASTSVKAVRKLRESAAQAAARALRNEPLIHVVNGVTTARQFAS